MQVLRIAWFLDMIYTKFARLGYQSLFQVILERRYFVFKSVTKDRRVFCSFPIVKEHQCIK